jgi:F0F1-type ATP synthase assembly protein I
MPDPSDTGGSDKQRRKALTSYSQAGTYIGSGFQFAGTMVAGLFGGRWLDEKLSTAPLFLISGILLGAVAGFYHLYKTLVQPPPGPAESPQPEESAEPDSAQSESPEPGVSEGAERRWEGKG